MKKLIALIFCSCLSPLTLAGNDHQEHATPGHDASAMSAGDMMYHSATGSVAGKPGEPSQVSRTVEVLISEGGVMTPEAISVKPGETIRFFFKNASSAQHQMAIGSQEELKAHARMMQEMAGMTHNDPGMVTLQPGQRGGLIWQFNQNTDVYMGCMVAGHMEAGMLHRFNLTP